MFQPLRCNQTLILSLMDLLCSDLTRFNYEWMLQIRTVHTAWRIILVFFDSGFIFIVAAIIFISCENIVIIFAEVWEHSDHPTTKTQGARNSSTAMIRQVVCPFDFEVQLQQRAPEMVLFPHCHTTKASWGDQYWVTFSIKVHFISNN